MLEELKSRILIHNAKISLPKDVYCKIRRTIDNFTNGMRESHDTYNKDRRASKPLSDNENGKYGEFIASVWYVKNSFPLVIPDLEIRHGNEKGWECDLPFSKKNIEYPDVHVKTCTDFTSRILQDRGDKFSWMMQVANEEGPGGRDKMMDRLNSDEVVAFVYAPHIDSATAFLIATAPLYLLIGNFEEPVFDKYKGLKRCIYYKRLKALSENTDKLTLQDWRIKNGFPF